MSSKRRFRHRKKPGKSDFTGSHSKAVFAIQIIRRPELYQLVPEWWYAFFDMNPEYPTAHPMIYKYFASARLVTGVRSRNLDAIAVADHARQVFSTILGVALRGTSHRNFDGNCIWHPRTEIRRLNRL